MYSASQSYVSPVQVPCENGSCFEDRRNREPDLCPSDIYCTFANAGVNFRAIPKWRVVSSSQNETVSPRSGIIPAPIEDTNSFSLFEAGIVPISYSGFYIEDGFIVSSTDFLNIVFVAFLLFFFAMNDTYKSPGQRVNYSRQDPRPDQTDAFSTLRTTLNMIQSVFTGQSSISQWFDFYVEVFNVNGCGRSFIYKAFVVGADLRTGVAVYRIDPCDIWNKCLPEPCEQPYFKWGNSKCYTAGNRVYTIADFRTTGSQSLSSGIVIDNTNSARDGSITYEQIATTMDVALGAAGGPIVDQCGYLVGVITGLTNLGRNAMGVTSDFIRRVVDTIIADAYQPGCDPHAYYSPFFGFILYKYGTANLCYRIKTADDLHQELVKMRLQDTLDQQNQNPPSAIVPVQVGKLEQLFYSGEYCEINRELVGIILTKDPCGTLGDAIEQCRQAAPIFKKDCCSVYQILKGDLITHIEGIPLGQLGIQTTPDTIFYSLLPCDCVKYVFYKADELYTKCHSLASELDDSLCWLAEVPPMPPVNQLDSPDTPTDEQLVIFYIQLVTWSLNFLGQVTASTLLTNVNFLATVILNAIGDGPYVLSRVVLSIISKPAIETAVRPASFIDVTQSFPHGTCLKSYLGNSNVEFDLQGNIGTMAYMPGLTGKTLINLVALSQAARATQAQSSGLTSQQLSAQHLAGVVQNSAHAALGVSGNVGIGDVASQELSALLAGLGVSSNGITL